MRMLRVALVAAVGLIPVVADGQTGVPPELRPGVRARFVQRPEKKPRIGTVVEVKDSLVLVRVDREPFATTMVWDSLDSFVLGEQRSVGAGARHGAWAGFRAGVVLTAMFALFTELTGAGEQCATECLVSPMVGMIALGTVATAGATVGGALIGAASPGVTWTGADVVQIRARPSQKPAPGLSVGFVVRVRW